MQEIQKPKGRTSTRLVAESILQDETEPTLQSGDLRRGASATQQEEDKKKEGGGAHSALKTNLLRDPAAA